MELSKKSWVYLSSHPCVFFGIWNFLVTMKPRPSVGRQFGDGLYLREPHAEVADPVVMDDLETRPP